MDCRTFEKQVESLLRKDVEAKPETDRWQHFRVCHKCRDKYAGILGNHIAQRANPPATQLHGSGPTDDEVPDQLSDPKEFKDAPISFALHLNGREEAVKVVEPEMDIPLPDEGRLVVKENEAVWCDVIFTFNPESDRPYELHFSVLMGIAYAADHLIAFGIPLAEDQDLLSRYELEIVARGGVKAWIEMTRKKARLFIKYEGHIQ
jgi:hypothetical protein